MEKDPEYARELLTQVQDAIKPEKLRDPSMAKMGSVIANWVFDTFK